MKLGSGTDREIRVIQQILTDDADTATWAPCRAASASSMRRVRLMICPFVRLYLPKNGCAVFGAQDNVGEEE